MEREHVALAQQAAELDPSGAGGPLELGPRAARRVEDPQPERHRPAAHRLADASGPEQAERPALELDPHVVPPGRRLVRGDPGDVEPRQLAGLEQVLQLGGDEYGVTHYLLICARRIESSTAIARAGLHL